MKRKKLLILSGALAILLIILLASLFLFSQNKKPSQKPKETASKKTEQKSEIKVNFLNQSFGQGKCENSQIKNFTYSPMRAEDLTLFVPLGLMVGGHVTPVDHQYFYPKGWRKGAPAVPLFAPADGFIVKINRYQDTKNVEGFEAKDGYDMVIEHSCTLYSKLGLLTGVSEEVSKQLDSIARGEEKNVRIPVKAGQEVASVEGQSLDFYTYDAQAPAKNWIVPEHYNEAEGIKRFITDSFLYFPENIKKAISEKTPRTVEPLGGRFDYDIDGKLVGTWFLQGTGGYVGNDPSQQGYWSGHLVFAYNELDPSSIEISMGSWNGQTQGYQFAVKNNSPDTKDVSSQSGLVKYELTDAYFLLSTGAIWNQEDYAGPVRRVSGRTSSGTLLVQVLSDRQIKVERFSKKSANQVSGFTSAAQLYER